MEEDSCLRNNFLIAMPTLLEPIFFESVTYVCEHSEMGAMGLVINHPIRGVSVGKILQHLKIPYTNEQLDQREILQGGPLQQDRLFILHTPVGHWRATLPVNEQVAITTSEDILRAIADGKGPEHFLVILGYTGWTPGQLEHELGNNSWLSSPFNEYTAFDAPYERRRELAAASVGVDLNFLSSDIGHA